MGSLPVSDQDVLAWEPTTAEDRRIVHEQVEKLLQHELFCHSRRYPTFLRTIIEFAFSHSGETLKERTLGVMIFDRSPAYDTNTDPIVRVTAAEVRKRIHAYYAGPGSSDEVIVTIPYGSYLPSFLKRGFQSKLYPPAQNLTSEEPTPIRWLSLRKYWRSTSLVFGIAAALVLACLLWPHSSVDRFWSPIIKNSRPVLIGLAIQHDMPNYAMLAEISATEHEPSRNNAIMMNDALPLLSIAGLLYPHRTPYRIETARQVTLDEMRQGPVLLIGAFDNIWTMRETADLRFSFQKSPDGTITWIRDRQHPEQTSWKHNLLAENGHPSSDYGIVARLNDDTATGVPIFVVAGLSSYATAAAGELLTDPVLLDEFTQRMPQGWDKRNIEAVLSTHVIDGKHSRPTVEAFEVW